MTDNSNRRLNISKILIANRGEIALRVIRACRDMGIASVAVYSEIDRKAPHVLLADEAYLIGPAPAAESYLRGDRIIEAAKLCGAEAVHPGYGFLAENGDFAEMCADNGIIFIGPPPNAIRSMGSKTEARAIMSEAGVPVVPGGDGVAEADIALVEAERIGYPVLIKAVFGGGGKGMRVVETAQALPNALESAARESASAFGNGTVYLEKFLKHPRHIEIQVLADHYGNVIHLGERECSIQRRHQKVIEESPSVVIDGATRRAMGQAALQAAKACGYQNAGTVEFMYTEGKYYFLEMNTRLQVEHPVTELITGIDLVREQIFIAQGQPLRFKQEDVEFQGHAIECRIYSEDENFLPDTGTISDYVVPQGPGVRVDGGVQSGNAITVHYDPMISKLLTWGEDRNTAVARMKRALGEYRISGVQTTIPFCLAVMENEDFISGDYHTGFVGVNKVFTRIATPDELLKAMAAAVSLLHTNERRADNQTKLDNQGGQPRQRNWVMTGRGENIR